MRMNPEDRAAFADARIAAVHAGLKLNADQEKLWPPVEAAVRDFAKLRIDRANARMNAEKDDSRARRSRTIRSPGCASAPTTWRPRRPRMKKIADAADPLYKTLDDGQKRRLAVLTHMGHRFGAEGWRQHRFERGMDRDDRDGGRDRGFDRDRYDGAVRTGAGPGGSDRRPPALNPVRRSRWNPAAFRLPGALPKAGKTVSSLLDIGESLC